MCWELLQGPVWCLLVCNRSTVTTSLGNQHLTQIFMWTGLLKLCCKKFNADLFYFLESWRAPAYQPWTICCCKFSYCGPHLLEIWVLYTPNTTWPQCRAVYCTIAEALQCTTWCLFNGSIPDCDCCDCSVIAEHILLVGFWRPHLIQMSSRWWG